MAGENSSDEECPQLVPINEHQESVRGKKVPVTIITGFLGEIISAQVTVM